MTLEKTAKGEKTALSTVTKGSHYDIIPYGSLWFFFFFSYAPLP
jgi:hypothetical protein